MANAQTIASAVSNLLTLRISRAAYEMVQRSGDRRTADVSAVVPLKGISVEITLSPACAKELKAWAQECWESASCGQRKTLSFLKKALAAALRQHATRDCIPDPGKKAILEARERGARLMIGAVVVDSDGDLVQIVSGPDFYSVVDEQGIYVDQAGCRFNWRYGYKAALCEEGGVLAGRCFFYAPYRLWSKDDGEITHLKLVHSADSH